MSTARNPIALQHATFAAEAAVSACHAATAGPRQPWTATRTTRSKVLKQQCSMHRAWKASSVTRLFVVFQAFFWIFKPILSLVAPLQQSYAQEKMIEFIYIWLGDGFKYDFIFTPNPWGRWTHFDSYFSIGLKPPTRYGNFCFWDWHGLVFSEISGVWVWGPRLDSISSIDDFFCLGRLYHYLHGWLLLMITCIAI